MRLEDKHKNCFEFYFNSCGPKHWSGGPSKWSKHTAPLTHSSSDHRVSTSYKSLHCSERLHLPAVVYNTRHELLALTAPTAKQHKTVPVVVVWREAVLPVRAGSAGQPEHKALNPSPKPPGCKWLTLCYPSSCHVDTQRGHFHPVFSSPLPRLPMGNLSPSSTSQTRAWAPPVPAPYEGVEVPGVHCGLL